MTLIAVIFGSCKYKYGLH